MQGRAQLNSTTQSRKSKNEGIEIVSELTFFQALSHLSNYSQKADASIWKLTIHYVHRVVN